MFIVSSLRNVWSMAPSREIVITTTKNFVENIAILIFSSLTSPSQLSKINGKKFQKIEDYDLPATQVSLMILGNKAELESAELEARKQLNEAEHFHLAVTRPLWAAYCTPQQQIEAELNKDLDLFELQTELPCLKDKVGSST